MGKHKEYNEDLRTSVVNELINERWGILEDPHPVDKEKLMKGTIVNCVKCQKVMFALLHRRLLLNTNYEKMFTRQQFILKMFLSKIIDFICVGPLVQISSTPNTIIIIRFFKL